MTPSADRRTFTLRVTLDPAARIEYLIAYRGRFELNPGNPRTVPARALIAPAIPANHLPALTGSAAAPMRFIIETGTYDVPLVSEARALRRALAQRHAPVRYVESPQRHNHTAFGSRLPAVMRDVFPPASRY